MIQTHRTSDIYLAAAFLSLGAKLKEIDRENPKHMEFEFEAEDTATFVPPISSSSTVTIATPLKLAPVVNLEAVSLQWANGVLMVSASAYAESIRRMKSLVHSKS